MEKAETIGTTLEAAMMYRDGFVIMLLAHRPILRLRNLHMIRCNEHLVHRNGQWHLLFGAHETKTKKPIELTISAEVAQYLERYLSAYRPILPTVGGQQPPAPVTAKFGYAENASGNRVVTWCRFTPMPPFPAHGFKIVPACKSC